MVTQRCNECGWPGQVLGQACSVCSHVNTVPWTTDRIASGEDFEAHKRIGVIHWPSKVPWSAGVE